MPLSQEDIAKAQDIARRFGKRWNDLAQYEPTQFVIDGLNQRDMSLQRIGNAVGGLNLDFYSAKNQGVALHGRCPIE